MAKLSRALVVLAILATGFCTSLPVARADETVTPPAPAAPTGGLIDRLSPECSQNGTCDFCDVLDGFSILTRWILGISGAAALAMFVWFGFQFIIANGNSSIIDGARKGMVGTVVGLALVFGAWEIVNLVLYAAVTPTSSNGSAAAPLGDVILFQNSNSAATGSWYQYCRNRPKPPGRIPGVTEN